MYFERIDWVAYLEEQVTVHKPHGVSKPDQLHDLGKLMMSIHRNKRRDSQREKKPWEKNKHRKMVQLHVFLAEPTNGTLLIAPTTVEVNQTATIDPPPYRITVVLFSTASHWSRTIIKQWEVRSIKYWRIVGIVCYLPFLWGHWTIHWYQESSPLTKMPWRGAGKTS